MTETTLSREWADVVDAKEGHVFCDEHVDGIRFVILRGPFALCAYVGVPVDHPIAGFDYNEVPIDSHGGLTYAGTGIVDDRATWFYGWDYAHGGDRTTYSAAVCDRAWTPRSVYADSWDARWDFGRLVRLAEKIASGSASETSDHDFLPCETDSCPLGFCYAEHEPPRPAAELLRLHLPNRPAQTVAACEVCAKILRMIAL